LNRPAGRSVFASAKISQTVVCDSSRMLIHALWLFAKSDQIMCARPRVRTRVQKKPPPT